MGLTVVSFKWKRNHDIPRFRYEAEHVLILRNMVARHYQKPHRFVCITDDARGLSDVETYPLWDTYANVPSPWRGQQPSCYRRLLMFSPDIEKIVGPRFVAVDLDVVITGDLAPLWDREEEFVGWSEAGWGHSIYNGSMWMMTAGARRQVVDRFNPKTSPREAWKAKLFGSDQAWISYVLGRGEASWTRDDGVYSYRKHIVEAPPKGTGDRKSVV